jgi:uncharacterized protein YwqG
MTSEVAEIVELSAQIASSRHVGRSNRLLTRRDRLFAAIDRHPDRLILLRALLDSPQREVRMAAAWRCGRGGALLEEAERAVTELAKKEGETGSQARNWLDARARMTAGKETSKIHKALPYDPAPPGCSHEMATALIARSLSRDRGAALNQLLARAIRLWPRAHAGDPRASRLGGLPMLPPGHAWPDFDGEPLLFLGQIDFAELCAAIGATPFPERGLLQFYGDHDEVMGCGPVGASAVFYFPDASVLQSTSMPIEDFFVLPRCDLDFFETIELPDPRDYRIAELNFASDEKKAYRDVRRALTALASHGEMYDRGSKLLGWPDLIQREVGEDSGVPGEQLLIQMGWWHDGAEHQCWGPGGLVYFILNQDAIAEARFDEAMMEMQCT